MLDVLLFHDGDHRLSRGGVVDVVAGEEFVDDVVHLGIAQNLSLWNGGIACKTERQGMVDVRFHARAAVYRRRHHLTDECDDVQPLNAGRDGIDGIASTAEAVELESHLPHLGQDAVEGKLVGGSELHHLREQHFLRVRLVLGQLAEVGFIEDADVGTVLVDEKITKETLAKLNELDVCVWAKYAVV